MTPPYPGATRNSRPTPRTSSPPSGGWGVRARVAAIAVVALILASIGIAGLGVSSVQLAGRATTPIPLVSPARSAVLAAPTSLPSPSAVYDARAFGAKGDGQTDDTDAIQAAIVAAAAAGGGVVSLPSGTYPISQARLAAGVTIRGSGVTATTIRAIGAPGVPTIFARGVARVGVSDLKVQGRGVAGGTGDEILVNLIDVPNARVSGVHLDRAQGIGLQVEGAKSSGGVYDDIHVTNTFLRGDGYHGAAFWFFHGPNHNTVSNLTTDTSDGPGLMLDAGTTVGTGAAVSDNTLTNITVLRAARRPGAAGIIFAGASRNTLTGFRIEDTFAQSSVALSIQQDQTGVPAEGNVIGNGIISDVGSSAFDLESSSRNKILDVSVRNIGRVESARLIQLTSASVDAGQTSLPSIGNTFSRLTLTQRTGSYVYGVRLDSTDVPILRNQFADIGWGSPAHGTTEAIGSNSPLTGIDANVL